MAVFHFKEFSIEQSNEVFKIGTDALILGAFCIKYSNNVDSALDIGCGTGVLGHILAKHFKDAQVTGIDLNTEAVKLANKNAKNNSLNDRLSFKNISLSEFANNSKFDLIISNPPFFNNSLKNNKGSNTLARHDDQLTIEDLLTRAKQMLKADGNFWFIYPFDRAEEVRINLQGRGFNIHREILIYGKKEIPVRIIFSVSKKKQIFQKESLVLRNKNGDYTNNYKELTRELHGHEL